MQANVAVSHEKLFGFEEISKSRWTQYILNLSESISEESYSLNKTIWKSAKKKNVTFLQISLLYGIFKA